MFRNQTQQPRFSSGLYGPEGLRDPGRSVDPFGTGGSAAAGREESVELIGTYLRAEGSVDLGRFGRLSDYVNFLGGFFNIREVTLLSRIGEPTRVTFPELRVRLGDIALVAQHDAPVSSPSVSVAIIPKQRRRLVVMTEAHIVYGSVYLHELGSISGFIDSSEPHFIPMTGVHVRWLTDRRLAGRFSFALLQRSHIVGVATDGRTDRRGTEVRTFEPAKPGILAQRASLPRG